MLITSTPHSKGNRVASILCKELGIIQGDLGITQGTKKSKGWEKWPMEDGISNNYTSVKKWVTSKDEIYHTHLLPSLKGHTKALGYGNSVSILRDPLDIIGSLDISKRNQNFLEMLRDFHYSWIQLSKENTQILIVNYRDLSDQKKTKSTIVGIAKHLGLDWQKLASLPYGFKIS